MTAIANDSLATMPSKPAAGSPHGDAEQAEQAEQAERPARAVIGRWDLAFAGAALAGELAIVAIAVATRLPLALAFAGHFVILAGLVHAIYRRRGANADLTAPLFTLIGVSASGPVGALVAVLALAFLRRRVPHSDLLSAWYQRISHSITVDPQTQLSDRIASGRVIDTRTPAPEALIAVMANGSLAQQQAALGLIARFFHPNYLDALAAALKSDVPVIRVQAAAVAARIRPHLAQQVGAMLATSAGLLADADGGKGGVDAATVKQRLAIMRDLDAAIRSGLLDAPVVQSADRVAARLTDGLDCLGLRLQRTDTVEGSARLIAFEQRLIASGEFQRLRQLRARRRLAQQGYARVRRWPGKHVARAGGEVRT